MESINELFTKVLTQQSDDIHCACPCKVTNVNGNYVDVIAYINDEEPDIVLYHVPIKRKETQRAYIFLGIKEGDYGTLTFFDKDTNDYIDNEDTDYNSNDEQHSINQRCFSLGFVPKPSSYVYPENVDIEIGMKDNSAKISFASGGINIISTSIININAPTINMTGDINVTGTIIATGEITGNSIPLSTHIHGNGNQGADTTQPKT